MLFAVQSQMKTIYFKDLRVCFFVVVFVGLGTVYPKPMKKIQVNNVNRYHGVNVRIMMPPSHFCLPPHASVPRTGPVLGRLWHAVYLIWVFSSHMPMCLWVSYLTPGFLLISVWMYGSDTKCFQGSVWLEKHYNFGLFLNLNCHTA